jgi:hypothetical protein
MLPVLPCGVPFDALKGECCATNCRESAVKDERDPRLRSQAIDACQHWSDGLLKAAVPVKKTAASKSRTKKVAVQQ